MRLTRSWLLLLLTLIVPAAVVGAWATVYRLSSWTVESRASDVGDFVTLEVALWAFFSLTVGALAAARPSGPLGRRVKHTTMAVLAAALGLFGLAALVGLTTQNDVETGAAFIICLPLAALVLFVLLRETEYFSRAKAARFARYTAGALAIIFVGGTLLTLIALGFSLLGATLAAHAVMRLPLVILGLVILSFFADRVLRWQAKQRGEDVGLTICFYLDLHTWRDLPPDEASATWRALLGVPRDAELAGAWTCGHCAITRVHAVAPDGARYELLAGPPDTLRSWTEWFGGLLATRVVDRPGATERRWRFRTLLRTCRWVAMPRSQAREELERLGIAQSEGFIDAWWCRRHCDAVRVDLQLADGRRVLVVRDGLAELEPVRMGGIFLAFSRRLYPSSDATDAAWPRETSSTPQPRTQP